MGYFLLDNIRITFILLIEFYSAHSYGEGRGELRIYYNLCQNEANLVIYF